MGSKYPVMKPSDIIKRLEKFGFIYVSQKGSHRKYSNNDMPKKSYIIPMHDEIARGTLKSILEQSGVNLDEFLNI